MGAGGNHAPIFPQAGKAGALRYDCDGFDFDHQVWICESPDFNQCACRRELAVILDANLAQCLQVRHVGDVRVDFHDVLERCADGGEREFQILEHLSCLRGRIAFADDLAGVVEGDLARAIDRPPAADFNDVGIAGRRR